MFGLSVRTAVLSDSAEMSVMREAVPVEGAERSVFEPLQLSAVRDPADGVERGAEPGEEVGGETRLRTRP